MSGHRRLPGIAAVLLLGASLAACDPGTPASTAASTASSLPASPTAQPSPSSSSATTLGPTGFGPLVLGMTKAQARATGAVTGMDASDKGRCGNEGLLAGTPAGQAADDVTGMVFFSAGSSTLVAIYASPGLRTPEGIGLGSTYEQVHAAYPTWQAIDEDPTNGRGGVAVPGNPGAHYRIVVLNHKVTQLSLDSNQQDCYE